MTFEKPVDTVEDIEKTKELMLQLVEIFSNPDNEKYLAKALQNMGEQSQNALKHALFKAEIPGLETK
jgi:hypothetical protein